MSRDSLETIKAKINIAVQRPQGTKNLRYSRQKEIPAKRAMGKEPKIPNHHQIPYQTDAAMTEAQKTTKENFATTLAWRSFW